MKIKYTLLVFCFIISQFKAHEIILEKIENAFGEDNKFLSFDGLRVKKFNRTRLVYKVNHNFLNNIDTLCVYSYVVSGKYNLKTPLDDNIDIFVEAFNFQGGQYKKMADKKIPKICTTLYTEQFERSYALFYEASSVKTPFGTCPFPAGINEITDLMFIDNGMIPPYIPGSEKWRGDIRFIKKGEVLGGYNLYVMLRSKNSLMQGG